MGSGSVQGPISEPVHFRYLNCGATITTMSDLPRVNAPGLRVWRAVLLELLRREQLPIRERQAAPPLSISFLARLAGKSVSQVKTHVETMASAKFVEVDVQMGPQGADIKLTGLGRLVARILKEAQD